MEIYFKKFKNRCLNNQNSLNRVIKLGRVCGSIWKYRMQLFSWRMCTVHTAGVNVECQRHQLLGEVQEICKIGLSKMQFPAFPGPDLGNLEGFLRALKNAHKKYIHVYDRNYLFFSIVCITCT